MKYFKISVLAVGLASCLNLGAQTNTEVGSQTNNFSQEKDTSSIGKFKIGIEFGAGKGAFDYVPSYHGYEGNFPMEKTFSEATNSYPIWDSLWVTSSNFQPGTSFKCGLTATFEIDSYISLQTGLVYRENAIGFNGDYKIGFEHSSSQGFLSYLEPIKGEIDSKLTMQRISLPLHANITIGKKVHYSFFSGFSFEYLVKAVEDCELLEYEIIDGFENDIANLPSSGNSTFSINRTNEFKKMNLNVNVGFLVEIPLFKNISLSSSANYSIGLSNFNKVDPIKKSNLKYYSFNLGVNYHL